MDETLYVAWMYCEPSGTSQFAPSGVFLRQWLPSFLCLASLCRLAISTYCEIANSFGEELD